MPNAPKRKKAKGTRGVEDELTKILESKQQRKGE